MSKVILVIDMPDSCRECTLHGMAGDFNKHICVPMQKTHDKFANKKPDWCPLKPIPEKQIYYTLNDYDNASMDGWNECIDEILGEL